MAMLVSARRMFSNHVMLLFKINTYYYELIILFSSADADQSISVNAEAALSSEIDGNANFDTQDVLEPRNAFI